MARIRTIKPEFPHSESMGRVSRDSRLLFIMLWTLVDDSGITRGNSRMLASLLFPYDDDAGKLISSWMEELDREGCIVQYVIDGQTYVQICNWLNHQKIDKPSQSKFPSFDNSREDSRILPVGEDQGKDQGKEWIGMDKKGSIPTATSADKKTPKPKTISPLETLLALGVAEQAAADWLTVRKAKRAPLTDTALDELKLEAVKAGITVGQAVAICAKKSWQGFNSSWNWKNEIAGRKPTEPENFNEKDYGTGVTAL